jgi:ADP-ribose pyrophosphatase YjhB (NUDIX family)
MDASGAQRFRFCPRCGARFDVQRIEDRDRLVCSACDYIHYQNPTAGVAVLLLHDGAVLLTRRAHGRGAGLWDVPGGWVEYDEDLRAAAARELLEETGLHVSVGAAYEALSNFHSPEAHTVGIWFLGAITGGELRAADDASDARFFPLDTLPPLAFPTDALVLARLRADIEAHSSHD